MMGLISFRDLSGNFASGLHSWSCPEQIDALRAILMGCWALVHD